MNISATILPRMLRHGTRGIFPALALIAFIVAPCRLEFAGFSAKLQAQSALAKDGGSGKSNGNGKGNGKSGGGGKSPGAGHSKGSNSESGGKSGSGKSKGGDTSAGTTGRSAAAPASPAAAPARGGPSVKPRTEDRVRVRGSDIEVLHSNGIKEAVEGERYEMKDAKGRTIINRRATSSDRERLRGLAG